MYFVGDKNENNRKAQNEIDQTFVKPNKHETAEFGLVEELVEENKV